jgi:hypothetical protein
VAANINNALNRVCYLSGLGIINLSTTDAVIPGDPRALVVTPRYEF